MNGYLTFMAEKDLNAQITIHKANTNFMSLLNIRYWKDSNQEHPEFSGETNLIGFLTY